MDKLLKDRWFKLCKEQEIPNQTALWEAISTMYNESSRVYHNLQHIADCLYQLDQWPGLKPNKKIIIELALWLHDIIFDTKRTDNESASAGLAKHYLNGHPFAEPVFELILATRHRASQMNQEEYIICDIDLSILASKRERYDTYSTAIRTEFSWVPEEMFLKSRLNVLRSFIDRESIFSTDYYRSLHEDSARENVAVEIGKLSSRLAEL